MPVSSLLQLSATVLIYILPLVFAEDADADADADVSNSCSDYYTCGDCSSSKYCHWCASDEACHTYGSWYGCTYGVNCNSIDRCMRDQPEKLGYTWKGIAGLMGFGFVAMGLFLWKFSSSNAAKNVTATSISNMENDMPVTPYLYQQTEMRGGKEMSFNKAFSASTVNSSLTVFQAILSVSIAVALVMLIVLSPKLPQVNICSTEFDWDSILEGLQDGYFQTSIISLLSIYNPSLYAVKIQALDASFRHGGVEFGTFSMDPVIIYSQSITDDLVTATFQPENTQVVYDLLSEYALGTLNITVDVNIEATFPSISKSTYKKNIKGIFVDLSDDGESDDGDSDETESSNSFLEDRHLCQCSYRRILRSQLMAERKLMLPQEDTPYTIDSLRESL